jgi:hypothetical protein
MTAGKLYRVAVKRQQSMSCVFFLLLPAHYSPKSTRVMTMSPNTTTQSASTPCRSESTYGTTDRQ